MEVFHEEMIVSDDDLTLDHEQFPLHGMYYTDLCGSAMLEEAFLHGNDAYIVDRVDSHGVSNFHMCCTLNNPDLVIAFLDKEVDVNGAVSFSCPKNPGFTPLHFAVKHNCTDVVEILLQNEADCNMSDEQGRTALHLACEKMNDINGRIIDLLLEFDASPAVGDEKGVTPLHVVFYGAKDLRESRIDQFFSKIPRKVNFADDQGLSFFHMVCTRGDTSRVNDFLELRIPVDICVASGLYGGHTPLHFAVLCNQTDVVEFLLQNNAQVNMQTDEHLLTPLHMACKLSMKYNAMDVVCSYDAAIIDWESRCKNDFAIMELLLRYGADVEAEDSKGKTPLIHTCTIDQIIHSQSDYLRDASMFAKEYRVFQKRMIEILLSYGANILARTQTKETVLHAITKSDFWNDLEEDLVEYLIIEGAELDAQDSNGFTPLHLAVQFTNITLMNLFLKYQANCHLVTDILITPLEVAIHSDKVYGTQDTQEVITALLECGADANGYSENGRTLLELAVKHRMTFVVKKLLEYGADPNMKGLRTYTIVSYLRLWYEKLTDADLVRVPAYGEIVNAIFTHVLKLLALGIRVDIQLQKWCVKLILRIERIINPGRKRRSKSISRFIKMDSFYRSCVAEVTRIEYVDINSTTTLYDVLLLEDPESLAMQIRSDVFIEIMENLNQFPLYSYLISRQLNAAMKRRNEMENAKTSLDYISGTHIPEPCCDTVLKYLTTEDIKNLNLAVHISKKTQRKFLQHN